MKIKRFIQLAGQNSKKDKLTAYAFTLVFDDGITRLYRIGRTKLVVCANIRRKLLAGEYTLEAIVETLEEAARASKGGEA